LSSFVVPYKFQDYFFCFCEKCHWNSDSDYVDQEVALGSMDTLTIFF